MTTEHETRPIVGQRVAARITLTLRASGERTGTIEKGTQGTVVSSDVGPDGVGRVRVRWEGGGHRMLRLKREQYERALTEIKDQSSNANEDLTHSR